MTQTNAITPATIDVDRSAGRLSIGWADGHRTEYAAEPLRLLCPCAFCRGEMGQPGWLDTNPALNVEQTQIVAAGLVGQYALNLTWGDGHDSGYYTFESLRANCPCPTCTADRSR
jgi:DUF971 family protein